MDKSILNIILNITKTIDKEGYLTEEKELVKKLISKRGKPGHCPLPS